MYIALHTFLNTTQNQSIVTVTRLILTYHPVVEQRKCSLNAYHNLHLSCLIHFPFLSAFVLIRRHIRTKQDERTWCIEHPKTVHLLCRVRASCVLHCSKIINLMVNTGCFHYMINISKCLCHCLDVSPSTFLNGDEFCYIHTVVCRHGTCTRMPTMKVSRYSGAVDLENNM